MKDAQLDIIGVWSELKLEIIRQYAQAYSTIMAKHPLEHIYIDGFAGAGLHVSKTTGKQVEGSPAIALAVKPPFKEYHFIDLDGQRADQLRALAGKRTDVHVYADDCNYVLLHRVFPKTRYEDYRRALCLLDPYGISLDWKVVETAGKMKSVEIVLNFMVMDMNRNVLLNNPDQASDGQIARMTRFWGNNSWRQAAYRQCPTLFGEEDEKTGNDALAREYVVRLKDAAGFRFVPDPLPLRNSRGAVVYYLFFASQNQTGAKIASAIFKKYRT